MEVEEAVGVVEADGTDTVEMMRTDGDEVGGGDWRYLNFLSMLSLC